MNPLRILAIFAMLMPVLANAADPTVRTDQTFTIITKIYANQAKAPAAHHRLLFDSGVIYDLDQVDPDRVAIYDPAAKDVTLLDLEKKIQTRLSTDELVAITAGAKAAATTPELREHLGLDAKVVDSVRVEGYAISFAGIEYDVSVQTPRHRWMATDFGRFSDLATRLNLVRREGVIPFARMTLGSHIAAAGEIPLETRLKITRGQQTSSFTSTATIGTLSEEDRKTIEDLRGRLALYRQVPISEL
ncbi:hypothetical protein N9N28_11305 [Rubripirellula amarantea]|uniref:DUF4412 domain-containing protein n=1 Tax=Rubripirellula amarantea TaxID=2527999 RepID=A0A5C5WW88_9BACT|nr:hypothetical protein [Rubripirellula amarantea]MDA8745211.1 hypothetical protein [Rubripirellula amarantea]TWT54966.1 hypothetical protein Pla22_26200 [Rubripirellula amarantea]